MDDLERHRWERLLRWLREQHGMDIGEGALHVQPREVPGAGRGLFAVRDCPPSTTLFKVPATALMNKKTVAKLYAQLHGQTVSGVQVVTLHLLLHKPLGSAESRDPAFGPYISTLPRDFSAHPLTWLVKRDINQEDIPERHLLDLLPPSTYRRLSGLHDRFQTDWKTVLRLLSEDTTIVARSSRPDMLSTTFHVEDHDLLMDYLWAWLNVNTRCIFYRIRSLLSDPDNFTLCPILDFANHSCGPTHIFPVIDSEVWGAVAKKAPRNFLFFGPYKEALSSGQELYLRYGSHPNSTLLSEYGFVNHVPDGAVTSGAYPGEVDVQDLVEELFVENPLGSCLQVVLEEVGYWGDWTIHSAPTSAHPSYRLMAALRLLHAFDDNPEGSQFDVTVDQWRKVIYGQAEEISPHNEEKWRQSLHRICGHIIERADRHLKAVTATDCDGINWRGWMVQNMRVLWKEEIEVGKAVAASVSAGVDF